MHVSNAGRMLEETGVERSVTKYGHARSWRRNRLIADGFALDAYGLDAAARGAKIDEMRPDIIILDDVDGAHDSPQVIARKIHTITHSLLPAGATSLAVLAVQNLPNRNGVFAQARRRPRGVADGPRGVGTVSGRQRAAGRARAAGRRPQPMAHHRWHAYLGRPEPEGLRAPDQHVRPGGLQGRVAARGAEIRRPLPARLVRDRRWLPARGAPGALLGPAATEPQPGSDPDWTVGLLMAAYRGQFWIGDVQRLRGSR